MKTEYDAYAAFLYPNTGEQERRFFYALMLRSRGKKSLEPFPQKRTEKQMKKRNKNKIKKSKVD